MKRSPCCKSLRSGAQTAAAEALASGRYDLEEAAQLTEIRIPRGLRSKPARYKAGAWRPAAEETRTHAASVLASKPGYAKDFRRSYWIMIPLRGVRS